MKGTTKPHTDLVKSEWMQLPFIYKAPIHNKLPKGTLYCKEETPQNIIFSVCPFIL